MIQETFFPVFGVILLATPLLSAQASRPAQDPRLPKDPRVVIAVVGKTPITWGDIEAEARRQLPRNYFHGRVSPERIQEMRIKSLDLLIERSLIEQDAKERKIPVSEKEISDKLEGAIRTLRDQLPKLPTEEEKENLRKELRPSLIRRILIDKNEIRFEASIPAFSQEEIRKFYDDEKRKLLAPPEAHLLHIFISVDPGASEPQFRTRLEKARTALKLIHEGRPFGEIARLYSEERSAKDGGDLGVVMKGNFGKRSLDEAAFELEEGKVSGIIRSLYGFHIVKCLEKKPRRQLRFEEVKPKIESHLVSMRRRRARKVWMEELERKFGVERRIKLQPFEKPAPPESKQPKGPASRPSPPPGEGRSKK